eukprot:scpid30462/ scgid30624/ Probable RNA-directed DNA polymerase from transposon BS; Reverse transcriptase
MASLNPLAPSFFPSKSNLTRPTSICPTHDAEPLPALLADVTSSHPPYTPITHSFHLRIGQLNCQSATHKIPVIESLLHTASLDLLFLCETWFYQSLPDAAISIPGYSLLRKDRDGARHSAIGGGLAVYIRQSLMCHFQRRTDLECKLEHICVEFIESQNSRKNTFHMFYRPPHRSSAEKHDFFVSFQSTIANALSASGTTVILGDFNAKLRQWNATDVDTAEGKQLAGLLDDLALQQIVRNTATRYSATGSQSSLLDLVITDAEHRISDLEVLDPLSDHCPIIFKYLSGKHTPKHPPPRFVPDYANTDFQSLRQKLSSLPLRECMLGASTIESAWWAWESCITQAIASCLAYRRVSSRRQQTKPWFTPHLHHLHRQKQRLFRAAKRHQTVAYWLTYKAQRNAYQNQLRNAKTLYFKRLSENIHDEQDAHLWWKKAKTLANISCKKDKVPDLTCEGYTAQSEPEKAEMLAKVFERQCTPAHGTGPIPAPADDCPNELFSLPVLAESSVYRVLRRLPQHKATGGNISNRILREIAPCITSSVTNLFNASLTLGEFPSAWKLGTVIPIFKNKGNPCDPSNYRPITLLPAIAKALDKIVATKFGHYLEVNNIIVPEQFGFVRDRSTVDQLIQLTTKIASTMDKRIPYDAAFLDFAKAFDKVPHDVLLQQLGTICDAPATSWFKNYLDTRTFSVRVQHHLSSPRPVKSGVPQGSHLGPLLFLVHINSLPSASKRNQHADVYLFADDTAVGQARTKGTSPMETALQDTFAWADRVGGTFNPSKTVVISFAEEGAAETIRGIQPSTSHRHLGVLLSETLSFQEHIEQTISKFRQRCVLLCHMADRLTGDIVRKLYLTYVRPTAEYAAPVWDWESSLSAAQRLTLERLQARVARTVMRLERCPCPSDEPKSSLFKQLGWPSLSWRRKIACLMEFFHLVTTQPELFEAAGYCPTRSRRRQLAFTLPRVGKHAGRSFLFFTATVWNALPADLRATAPQSLFHSHICTHFSDTKHNATPH